MGVPPPASAAISREEVVSSRHEGDLRPTSYSFEGDSVSDSGGRADDDNPTSGERVAHGQTPVGGRRPDSRSWPVKGETFVLHPSRELTVWILYSILGGATNSDG